jgi:hypothetical protein
MNAVVYPQLETGRSVDLRRDVPRLEVPYYMLDGKAELMSRRGLALEWYAQLQAPIKQGVHVRKRGALGIDGRVRSVQPHSAGDERPGDLRGSLTPAVIPG